MIEEELLSAPQIKFTEHYKKMWPYVKPYWFRALLAVLISVPIGALDAVVALALKPYMDIVLIDKSHESPVYIPLLIVAFTSLQGFLNYFATYLNTWVGTKIDQDLKRNLYRKLLFLEPSYFDKHSSGYVLQRFGNDSSVACSGLLDNLKLFVSRFFSSVSLICVLIYNSWQLSIIAILVLFFALLPLASVRRRIKNLVLKSVAENSKIFTNYNEAYSGNKTIAAYNMQEHEFSRFDTVLTKIFKITIKMVQKVGWMTPMMHIIVSIGIGGVIGYGSYLIVNGDITSGNFVSFITALVMLYNPIKSLGKNFQAVQVSFLAIERVAEILEVEPAIGDKPGAKELPAVKKSIEYKNVNFEYTPGVPVLKNVSFSVKPGMRVAFVGNSGGGKSTLVNLLPRFYEVTGGGISIDSIDIRDYKLHSLRDNIAVVFQDNFLFAGTIRDNIMIGKADATDEEVRRAVKMAYLDDFINDLEKGLDTDIGERGALLSGGQRQRLAIARAFLKNSQIVVLDEATSALDNKAEAVVQKAIDNLMQDRTVFVIAHRLSTVQNADLIMVVNDGEIVESGRHEELLQIENGAYKALYNAQFKNKHK
ncbi:MAG: ABC transporter transmembrane domain-containing protein [Pseudomonadota bacterium]|nr:ABC transporter transmembrane domain-containing protein [Pseudomonadota bacterium]